MPFAMEIPRLITILGPTAVGKTRFAALLADAVNGEIISADSRQVYRGMTIGTGKDLQDYLVNGREVPYHLIDILHPNEEFNVFLFKKLFIEATEKIHANKTLPILCGGTGLYIDAVLRDYCFAEVPINETLRKELADIPTDVLAEKLKGMKHVHNKTDLEDRERLIRAIEIQHYQNNLSEPEMRIHINRSFVFGIALPREIIRQRIAIRLEERLNNGMIEEVETLIQSGVEPQRLLAFGLEYRYITLYLMGRLSKEEMHSQLLTAIRQFAKRQMTWFRRMERLGVKIEWIDGTLPEEKKLKSVLDRINPN